MNYQLSPLSVEVPHCSEIAGYQDREKNLRVYKKVNSDYVQRNDIRTENFSSGAIAEKKKLMTS